MTKKVIIYGSKVQLKDKVFKYYNSYNASNCPPWMKSHSGRGVITHGPNTNPITKQKTWTVGLENTGQAVIVNEKDIKLVKE